MSEYPEATNLRRVLERVHTGLMEQAAGLDATNEVIADNLRTYSRWLAKLADNVRYDGTVDWSEIRYFEVGVALEPTLPELVGELTRLTAELEERVDSAPEDDESLASTLRDLESRLDSLES